MKNFVLYIIFGVLGASIEYSVFFLLTFDGLLRWPELANVVGASAGFCFTFSTNTFLNFKKKDKVLFRFFSYGFICLCGMAFSTLMLLLLKQHFNIYALKFVLMCFVSMLQFLANKRITYRDMKKGDDEEKSNADNHI